MKTKHLEQANEHADWPNVQWNVVAFSDEFKFNVHGCTGKYVT
jgi:hypothetical protein